MSNDKIQRKLKAIFSADVKGYSKLMGDDDEHTVHAITRYLRARAFVVRAGTSTIYTRSPQDYTSAEYRIHPVLFRSYLPRCCECLRHHPL